MIIFQKKIQNLKIRPGFLFVMQCVAVLKYLQKKTMSVQTQRMMPVYAAFSIWLVK